MRPPDVDLDVQRRDLLIARLTKSLAVIITSARIETRGSLADGRADRFSDVDLQATVAGDDFGAFLSAAPAAVAKAQPIRLMRVDPESLATPDRRLLFVLFDGVPLFWRLDLEVVASPPPTIPTTSLSSLPWSLPASALMNAIAAIKALARANEEAAAALLSRGFQRIAVTPPETVLPEQVRSLAAACAKQDRSLADIADEVTALAALYD